MAARKANGQFKKKSSGKRRRSSPRGTTVALAVRETVSIAPQRRRSPAVRTRVVAVPRRRRRSGGGGGAGSMIGALRAKVPGMLGSAAYGWLTLGWNQSGNPSGVATMAHDLVTKLPTLSAIGAPASHGVIFTLGARYTSGRIRQILDLLGTAALHRAAHNLGASGWDNDKASQMSGEDGDMSGEIGEDDLRGDED